MNRNQRTLLNAQTMPQNASRNNALEDIRLIPNKEKLQLDFDFDLDRDIFPQDPNEEKGDYIVMPEQLDVLRLRNSLDINIKWYLNLFSFFKDNTGEIIFSICWNVALLFMMSSIFIEEGISAAPILLVFAPFIAVGANIVYQLVKKCSITTTLHVTRDIIQVQNRPWKLSFRKRKQNIKVSDVQQIYAKKRKKFGSARGKRAYKYDLYVLTKKRTHIKLLENLNKDIHAKYIEQEIEDFLGIKQQRLQVKNEYRG